MRRLGILPVGIAALMMCAPAVASAAPAVESLAVGTPAMSTSSEKSKIDVMALWAHPDDDAGFATPCGVWKDLYGIKCGIIMVTRGEGGSNSVGNESGPQLGLRRENEDRASHVRSGTIDIFNLDRIDFYYNTSAPLTEQAWNGEETLRRAVRVIRETRPSIMIGWPPNFNAGHGNHQYAARLIWEAVAAAADPQRFPEQLSGVGAVKPWQVKKVIQQMGFGFNYEGTGGQAGPNCNVGYKPAADNPFIVAGTWSGYESPYKWVAGNTAGVSAGTPKTWAQVGGEGARAYPTQARTMQKDLVDPSCLRYLVLKSFVPMQPGGTSAGDKDNALFLGAAKPDPGGFPLNTLFSLRPNSFDVAPGEPFEVSVHLRLPSGVVPSGAISLSVPSGWMVSKPVSVGGSASAMAKFVVTPSKDAAMGLQQLAAKFDGGGKSAWNVTQVQTVPKVEGLFERTGNSAELDSWFDANDVYIYGRSPAINDIGAGESKTIGVKVTNRSHSAASGTVKLTLPQGIIADAASKSFSNLAPNASTTVNFLVTHTDPNSIGGVVEKVTATTTIGTTASSEDMQLYVVPSTVIPELKSAPVIDGVVDDVYTAKPISVRKKWEGEDCKPDGVDCGKGSEAHLGWYQDALYAQITVIDDKVSAAAPPDRCFGHWLVDSVELLADPRGNSANTSSTFKLGMFPFTDDPKNFNGNGVNGVCWSRDADNHQGFSTGPLAQLIDEAPNAPGAKVAAAVERASDGTYKGGSYSIEVKVPLEDLPAAVGPTSKAPTGDAATNRVDPTYMGFNLTPYDSDNSDFIGETRTAWSAFGSQQSEPYRWGHAYLAGYQPPADRQTKANPPIIPDTALTGVESPQTIHQSAMRGITMSGVQPTDSVTVKNVRIERSEIVVSYDAKHSGTLRGFVWSGDPRFVPVWTSSCSGDTDGFDACSVDDGKAPKWSPDMGGRMKAKALTQVAVGTGQLRIPIADGVAESLARNSELLLSFAENRDNGNGVTAWAYPIVPAGPTSPPPSGSASTGTNPESTAPSPSAPPIKPRVLPGTGVAAGLSASFLLIGAVVVGAVVVRRR